MRMVQKYVTFDGNEHNTKNEAIKHLDALYSDSLVKLAHRIVQETDGKYGKTVEFIHANLSKFVDLTLIENDKSVFEEDNEEA